MKNFRQKIKDYFITNPYWRKLKIFINNFVKIILLRLFLFIIVIGVILILSIQIYKPHTINHLENKLTSYFYSYLKLDNLVFSKISISGNSRIKNDEIIAILKEFASIKSSQISSHNQDFMVVVNELIKELKSRLSWLDTITIKRIMPDILEITITEYQPFAIWISDDKKFIIDKDGNQIPYLDEYDNNEEFKNMIILSGKGANHNAKSLFNILAINSEISKEVYSANWVGNRRWDIRFFDGLLVKLPEIEISKAWNDLIQLYEKIDKDKTIKSIDLRVSGKIYIQYFENKSIISKPISL